MAGAGRPGRAAPECLSPAASGGLPAANAAEMLPRRENAVGRKFAQSDFSGGIAIDFTGRRCYNLLVFKITTIARLLHGIVVLILPQNGLCFFGYEKYYLMQEVPR